MMNEIDNIRQSTKKPSTIRFILTVFIFITLLLLSAHFVNAQASNSYRLIGMIQSRNFTGIVMSDSKGEQSFYRLSDKMPDGSQIVEIRSNSISLRRTDGTLYNMFISVDTKTNASVASVKPDVPVDPYAPGAIRNTTTEQQNPQVRPHGRRGRTQSGEE